MKHKQSPRPVFKTSDLHSTQCKQFSYIDESNQSVEAFAVKYENQIYAYKNLCPHTGAELNWQEDNFLNFDHSYILCSIHGALFEPEDGLCILGPCRNQYLHQLSIYIQNNEVFSTETTNQPDPQTR